jgi:hypothetical protein
LASAAEEPPQEAVVAGDDGIPQVRKQEFVVQQV